MGADVGLGDGGQEGEGVGVGGAGLGLAGGWVSKGVEKEGGGGKHTKGHQEQAFSERQGEQDCWRQQRRRWSSGVSRGLREDIVVI